MWPRRQTKKENFKLKKRSELLKKKLFWKKNFKKKSTLKKETT